MAAGAKSKTRGPSRARFRATIRRQGPNPYVDVPERVSRAFEPYGRDGRISVLGALNGRPMRTTLIPQGRGRHRLFVNGGMRAAAGVGVGDTVSFELAAVEVDDVRPPPDVAAGLRRVKGARAAFEALSPSHRRELLRHVDDARTPQTRRRRIAQIAEHALGARTGSSSRSERRSARSRSGLAQRPLWTCPKCGNEFVNRNQYHSCKRYDLSVPFAGKPPFVRELFERFRAMVERCGATRMLPYRDKVAFMARVRFAGAIPRKDWLDVAFWLPRRIESPRFRKIETINPNAHAHLLRVTDPKDLDRELAGWIREAYAVGRQQHLQK